MIRNYLVKLEGITPLLMHWDNIEWADQMDAWKSDPTNRKDSKAGDDRTPSLDHPGLPRFEIQQLRHDLIHEEFFEFQSAWINDGEPDLVGIADALADMVYVIRGNCARLRHSTG